MGLLAASTRPTPAARGGAEHGVRERRVGDEDLALGRAERHGDAREVHDGVGSQLVDEPLRVACSSTQVDGALVDAIECGGRAIGSDDGVAGCREPGAHAPTETAGRAGDDDEHWALQG